MKTKVIGDFLLEKFPLENCQAWDNCGWNLIFDSEIFKVLICIDLTKSVLDFAIKNNYNLIISHHPFFFYPTKKEEFQNSPYKKKISSLLKKHSISVLALHTNFDSTNNQTAFSIANQWDLDASGAIKIDDFNILIDNNLRASEILKRISLNSNLATFRANFSQDFLPKKVAILPGSGGILACLLAKKQKANLVITSDLKWSDQLTIKHHKIKVLEIPHLIEQVFTDKISQILQEKFKNIEIHSFKLPEILSEVKIKW
ncbi:Nif3-like dinuclear metal center hexameric protein [Mesomycoplasma ovipneumoniae]|uniref:Nif3-like dinuclear metal center hexameric protein n=1 Tax=Mesomycoplasma ovipneumoniae TaxID=29562 RepID=UPI00083E9291|nr:Nif3-like dinuclear metal center hexameric protein [Mesomycoplasma ovipneumoniae]